MFLHSILLGDSGYMLRQFTEAFWFLQLFPVVVQRRKTIVLPLLQYIDKVIDVFVQVQLVVRSCGKQSRSHIAARRILWTKSLTSLSWRRCRFPWSDYHRDSPVAVH